MIINDGCVIVYCISRMSLLDRKSIFLLKKSPFYQFEIAFSDIWIFLTIKGVGWMGTSNFVKKKNSSFLN